MASYEPPTENLAIFDPSVFTSNDTPLTISEAAKYFLKYPNAQGTENLQTTNVNGVLTANAGIKSNSVEPIAITDTENICATQTSGTLNIGTQAGRTGLITIGTTNNTTQIGAWQVTGSTNVLQSSASNAFIRGTNISLNSIDGTTGVNIGSTNTTGVINVGSSQTSGILNLGGGANRTGVINIGIGPSATGQIFIGNSTNINNIGSCNIIGTNVRSLGNLGVGGAAGSVSSFGDQNTTGDVRLAHTQTSGNLFIANANRSTVSGSNGDIFIAPGTATGSAINGGCTLNIGTGARTINSDINIGTGLRDSTSDLNIGYCATTGVNTGVLHLQDGDQNSANIHIGNGITNSGNIQIANGASNSGNCNILTGASNSGDVSISTGATASGDVFIGNNANAAGVLQLNSRNIDIGTNGATNTVLALNAPLQPNYGGLLANTSSMIGYLFNPTANNLLAPTTGGNNICDFSLSNGVWMITATARLASVSSVTGQFFRVSLSKTSGTTDATTIQDYGSSGVGGTVYVKANGIFQCTGSTTIYYIMAIGTVGSVSIVSVNIQAVRIA
jgi:hypothetical protein